jgi:hypothetical protein
MLTDTAKMRRIRPKHRIHTGTPLALSRNIVDITLTSTLTAEDENFIAPAILKAVTNILDHLPIAYRVRIDTMDCQSYVGSGPDRHRLTEDGRFRAAPSMPLFDS